MTATQPPAAGKLHELKIRFVLGPAMLLLVAATYWLDHAEVFARQGMLSAIVLGLLALGATCEYVAMMRHGGFAVAGRLLPLFTFAAVTAAPFFGWHNVDRELYPLVLGTLLLLFPIAVKALLSKERMGRGLEEQGVSLLGFIWIAWPLYLGQGLALRHLPALLFVVLVCKGGDIGGYLVGVALGRRRLIPYVSAGKTWEGAAGSLLFSGVLAVLLRQALLPAEMARGLTTALGLGIMLNATTQIGDLVESVLKRRCGVKDSSALLPAHGGVLDLIDSLLFSIPAQFLILTIYTGP